MSCGTLNSLVYWEEPIASAAVFVPVAIILVALSIWSLIYVMAWTGLTVLIGVCSIKVFGIVMEKLGKPNPLGDPLSQISQVDLTVDPEKINSYLGCVVSSINCATSHIKKIIMVEDVFETVKFGALCYTLTYVGSWFNAITLVLIAWVLAFSLPKLYINNQAVADEIFGKLKVHVDSIQEKVFNKATPIKKDD